MFGKRGAWRDARVVFRKELLETLRDTRTLLIMIVVPVLLYPLLLVASEQLALFGRRQLARRPSPVALFGDQDPGLADFLGSRQDLHLVHAESVDEALRSDSVAAVALVGRAGPEGENRRVTLIFNGASDWSRRGRDVLSDALGSWGDTLLERRIRERGLPEGFARPFSVADSSVASAEELGGYALGRFLPMLLVVITLLGTFYPAIDLAAGEKERGTLETLLTAPIPPGEVVAGKFLTVTVVGLVAAALNLGSMLLTFQTGLFQLTQVGDVDFSLPFGAVLIIFGTLVPLAVLFGALFLGIAVRSRSFKEAQNALTPVYMVVMLPALLPLFPGIEFTPVLAIVPVAGVSLFFREIMSGTATLFLGSLALLSTLVYASAALIFAAYSFGREDVLFGDGRDSGEPDGRFDLLRALRHTEPLFDHPTPRLTFAFIAAVGVLFFYLGVRLQIWLGESGLIVAELVLILLPALLFLRIGGYDPVQSLSLRVPRPRGLVAGVLIISGGLPLAWLLAWLQGFVLPMPREFLEGMSDFLSAGTPSRIVWLLFVVALVPAVCEEVLFRGVLLSGTRARFSGVGVVVINGLIFGAFHVPSSTVFRFVPSATLGILLAWVVLRTRSIWISMLMHFLNNGTLVLVATIPWLAARFSDPDQGPPWWLLLPGLLALAAGAALLEGGRRERRESAAPGARP